MLAGIGGTLSVQRRRPPAGAQANTLPRGTLLAAYCSTQRVQEVHDAASIHTGHTHAGLAAGRL
jgi:hypothetical protein